MCKCKERLCNLRQILIASIAKDCCIWSMVIGLFDFTDYWFQTLLLRSLLCVDILSISLSVSYVFDFFFSYCDFGNRSGMDVMI